MYKVKLRNDQWSVGGAPCTKSEAHEFLRRGKMGEMKRKQNYRADVNAANGIINAIERRSN